MIYRIHLLITYCLFGQSLLTAQTGCPDPQALNFDLQALINDGSCQYPVTSTALILHTNLPNELKEISGHTVADGKWWAHEDGPTAADFYQINPDNGQILQKVTLQNGINKDWEEITSNSTHLFAADMGNNRNDREDLGIYKIPLNMIGSGNPAIIPDSAWTFIPFAYPDQTNFNTVPMDSTVYDAEALIWRNGKLHIFTKSWKTYATTHYIVNPENGATTLLETFNTNGLVTGAAISPDSQLVVLLGYNLKTQYTAFAWLLWDWPDPTSDLLFTGNKRRIDLGSVALTGQVESIAFKDNRSGYIGNERSTAGGVVFAPQSLKSFDFSTWVPESFTDTHAPADALPEIFIYPNPCSDHIFIEGKDARQVTHYQVMNSLGQVIVSGNEMPSMMVTRDWGNGVYWMEMWAGNKVYWQCLVKEQ